jgi:hypothetical protein
MPISPLAGKPAPRELLIDPSRLEREYYERRPDLGNKNQLVSFGTSGHRGSPLNGSFTEAHILAITQAICDYRRSQGYDGPLHMGKDTHAVSGPAQRTALEVLAGNNVRLSSKEMMASLRRQSSRELSSFITGIVKSTSPTELSSRLRTTRRRTVASSTTRPMGVRLTPM